MKNKLNCSDFLIDGIPLDEISSSRLSHLRFTNCNALSNVTIEQKCRFVAISLELIKRGIDINYVNSLLKAYSKLDSTGEIAELCEIMKLD